MDGRHVNSPKLSGNQTVLRRERPAPKLVLAASLYKRDFLSAEIRKTHLDEWTSTTLERTSRLRSDRPAAQLWQSSRRAQRHSRRNQPPDPRPRRGSRDQAVPSAQPLDRADRVGSRAASRIVGRLCRDPRVGATLARA